MSFAPSDMKLTPVEELPTEEKKEEKPEKKRSRPKYSKGRYGKLPPVKVMNKGIADGFNSTILRYKKKKLDKEQCEVGEAVMYMVEYYSAIDINHPALVMFSAIMGLTFTVMELAGKEDDPKTPKKKKTDIDIDAEDFKK